METKVVELELNDVLPNRFQPRIKFNEQSIQDLANSIKEHGVIQPIVVRRIGDKFEIIAGERRYKASVLAGKATIPAIITDLNEKESAEVALIENIQRKDLTPIEEAVSYKKILDMGYLTQDTLANKLGKTQSTIANKIRLLNLDDEVQEALLNEQISERHARSLLRITNHLKQREMLKKIIDERLTVRKADEEIDKMINNNENIEVLNFGGDKAQNNSVDAQNQFNYNEPIEELEVFNPSIETLNIPTNPIVDDTIPENLPQQTETLFVEPKAEVFNPMPEVITPTIAPVVEPTYDSLEVLTPSENISETLNPSIPTEPIVEQNSNTLETNDFINPGFMDINKIETDAKEIYEDKPLAPVENLLEPSFINSEIPTVPVEEDNDDSPEDILVPGKFFNLMPDDENQAEKPSEEVGTSDNFNFDLDINSLNNIESTNNISPIEDIEPDKPLTSFPEETPSFPNYQSESISSQPILNPLNNENSIHEIPVPLAPETTSTSDTIAELEIPEINNFQSLPDLENITAREDEYEPAPIVHPTNNSVDLKTAINMVRDFSEQLGRMGYVIDTDEFDFEDMYQIIFKINK